MPTLAAVVAALDSWYPPSTAESWDAVGLTCGDGAEQVRKVVLAVDCVPATVTETVTAQAQLLLTHHPLLLSGVHGVPASDPKGGLVHQMIRAGIAHFVAHTNADIADHGVSEALAGRLGLSQLRPIAPDPMPALDQLAVFVPSDHLAGVIEAITRAGAGAIGNYDQCTFTVEGIGTYRPLAGATPFAGESGVISRQPEQRLSVVLPRALRRDVIAAMRTAHPYEEVAFELSEQAALPAEVGTGRIGVLDQELSLTDFTAHAAAVLPKTVWGIRAAGDPARRVRTVAVCGGSGGSYANLARKAGADVYVTSDLKHHSTSEAVDELAPKSDGPVMALVDAAHWATERPWLDAVAGLLADRFGGGADGLELVISNTVTDPWTLHAH